MTRWPDVPGPGECPDPANRQEEIPGEAIPEGEMPDLDVRRRTLEMAPILAPRTEEGSDTPDTRRTSTDGDAVQSVAAHADDTEQRLDRSAHDLHRETTFDPAQDDAGPPSDKG
jgi:hypothetical protein